VVALTLAGAGMGTDHPIAWCQEYDGGRSWYSALGHTTESFRDPRFLAHPLAGIRHAAGQTAARTASDSPSRSWAARPSTAAVRAVNPSGRLDRMGVRVHGGNLSTPT
jgi:type 1 glutamine amidotransferase